MSSFRVACPTCAYSDVQRCRLRWRDLLFLVFLQRPYACCSCQRRFFDWLMP